MNILVFFFFKESCFSHLFVSGNCIFFWFLCQQTTWVNQECESSMGVKRTYWKSQKTFFEKVRCGRKVSIILSVITTAFSWHWHCFIKLIPTHNTEDWSSCKSHFYKMNALLGRLDEMQSCFMADGEWCNPGAKGCPCVGFEPGSFFICQSTAVTVRPQRSLSYCLKTFYSCIMFGNVD